MNTQYLQYMLYEADSDPVGLPSGVTFISDDVGNRIDEAIGKISAIYKEKGYSKVNPPIFEYYETFEKGSGYNIARRSFSFKDKDGQLLSLRYDMTTPISRMVAMKYSDSEMPKKFYYHGDVFREQPIHAGKPRQLRQVGIEFIGEPDISADVEAIDILGNSLSVLEKNYKIVVGDVKLYKHILSQLKLNHAQRQAINAAFMIKDSVSLKLILDEVEGIAQYKDILSHLPYMVGKPAEIEKLLKELDFAEMGFDIYIDRLINIIKKVSPAVRKHIIIDLGLIKDFSYYTSTTLEGYIQDVGTPVANGGRYDDLYPAFGKEFSAVGFAIDMSFMI